MGIEYIREHIIERGERSGRKEILMVQNVRRYHLYSRENGHNYRF